MSSGGYKETVKEISDAQPIFLHVQYINNKHEINLLVLIVMFLFFYYKCPKGLSTSGAHI